jgi:copper(I)-binding protein
MSRLRAIAAVAALGLSVAPLESQPSLRVTGAWVREPVPGRTMTAAYAVIENPGPADAQVVAVAADLAGVVEVHEMVRSGDMMKMSPVEHFTIRAKDKVALEPGGLHLMLFELRKPLKDGDSVTLTFTTGTGAKVRVAAAVKKPEMRQ